MRNWNKDLKFLQASSLGSVVELAFVACREDQRGLLVVVGHQLDVVDDCGQQVSAVTEDSRSVELQAREVNVEVVVGRLVVEVGTDLSCVDAELILQSGKALFFDVLEEWQMSSVEITNRLDGSVESQSRAVKRFDLAVPLQVFHQHEACGWI